MTANAANRIDGIDFWRGFALLTIFMCPAENREYVWPVAPRLLIQSAT